MGIMSKRSEIILKISGFPGVKNTLSPPINGVRSSITLSGDILQCWIVIIIDMDTLTEKLRHVFQMYILHTTQ